MIVNIAKHEGTVIERGVYYFVPYNYPELTVYELKSILAFIEYEKKHGRQTEIVCENATILTAVNNAVAHPKTVADASFPDDWETEFVFMRRILRQRNKYYPEVGCYLQQRRMGKPETSSLMKNVTVFGMTLPTSLNIL